MELGKSTDLIRLYIEKCSDGWVVGIDTLTDILTDIDGGFTYAELVEHYHLE